MKRLLSVFLAIVLTLSLLNVATVKAANEAVIGGGTATGQVNNLGTGDGTVGYSNSRQLNSTLKMVYRSTEKPQRLCDLYGYRK